MSINDNEFELKDPLIEDECEEDDNIDNVVVKVKRENKPKLSAKYENYMAFGYWFITKHIQHDNIQPFIDALRHKSDLTTQNEFYSQFVDNIKNHKKELKLSMKPEKNPKKKVSKKVSKVEPIEVSTDEPIVQLHVQLALQTDTKPTKTKSTKSTKTKSTINKPPIIETAVVPTESDNKPIIETAVVPIESDNKPIIETAVVPTDNKPIESDNKPIESDNKPKKIKKVKKDIQT
jgi:hypothetical protein